MYFLAQIGEFGIVYRATLAPVGNGSTSLKKKEVAVKTLKGML